MGNIIGTFRIIIERNTLILIVCVKIDLCGIDLALIFYPLATFFLVFTGIKLAKQYIKTRKAHSEPQTISNEKDFSLKGN